MCNKWMMSTKEERGVLFPSQVESQPKLVCVTSFESLFKETPFYCRNMENFPLELDDLKELPPSMTCLRLTLICMKITIILKTSNKMKGKLYGALNLL